MESSPSTFNGHLPVPLNKIPKIPLEPLRAFQAIDKSSRLFDDVLAAACYPPLMQPKSWTKAVPFKDAVQYCKPSESIGSCFSQSAAPLRIHALSARRKRGSSKKIELPFSETGFLQHPPSKIAKLAEIKVLKATDIIKPQTVPLIELCNGEFEVRHEIEQAERRAKFEQEWLERSQRVSFEHEERNR
ncbi:uncharacterized protein LOC113206301 [Frankliniella occidentalis]|uniref:Uncharacterized protein LOC113206301 n=1 Tax=Frankliniella occidentalis TaxID=133901 RepID=A0A9C6X7V2_FRAOC|nr:uncharacterized protein LOC113206301 [Frankliniella occidentalis]